MELGNYLIPDVAEKALKARGLQQVPIGDGISRFMSHDNGVPFRFFVAAVKNEAKSKIARYEVNDEVEMIQWVKDRFQKPVARVAELPSQLINIDPVTGEILGGRFADAYRLFKQKKESPGVPLDRWGHLSEGQVQTLVSMGIFSVEQFAMKPENWILAKFGAKSFFKEAHEAAQQFVNAKEGLAAGAPQLEQMLVLQQDNAKLKDELEQLRELVMNGTEAPKRRGKRPTVKVEEEEQ